MANAINLAKVYVPICDEIYKEASLTADLDGAAELMREGYNAEEMVIPTISINGLGAYSRNDGYTKGDATVTWETHKCNFDRGRMFSVDNLDDIETGGVAFGKLMGEFIRTKVVPELDAFRFSKYASAANISTVEPATLANGADVVAALAAAHSKMDNDEVPREGRILYITPDLMSLVENLDTNKSRAAINRAAKVVVVPQSRFYTKITQYDGSTEGQKVGGYTAAVGETFNATGDGSTKKFIIAAKPAFLDTVKVDNKAAAYTYNKETGEVAFETAPASSKAIEVAYGSGRNLNFMIIHPSAVIQFEKVVAPKIVTPDVNPDGDAWKYGYRNVGIADVYENKVAGIYAHVSAL